MGKEEARAQTNDWRQANEQSLREYAATFVGWATNEMGNPDELAFSYVEQYPLSDLKDHFQSGDWHDYYLSDVQPQEKYATLIDENFINPVVLSHENDEIILWDGYHRIATAFYRGDECIAAIVGKPKV